MNMTTKNFEELTETWKETFVKNTKCYAKLIEMKSSSITSKKYSALISSLETECRKGIADVEKWATALRPSIDAKYSDEDILEAVTAFANNCKECTSISYEMLCALSEKTCSELSEHIETVKNEELALLWVEASKEVENSLMLLTSKLHPLISDEKRKEFDALVNKALSKFTQYIRRSENFADSILPYLRNNIDKDEVYHIAKVMATACRTKNFTWGTLFDRNRSFYMDTISRTDARNGGTMTEDDVKDIMGEFALVLPQYLNNYRYGMAKFSTFITPYIYQPYRKVKRNVMTTGLSTYEENQLHSVNKAIAELTAQGREITVENIAHHLKIGARAACIALALKERVNIVYLDEEDSDGNRMQIADSFSLQDIMEKKDTKETVQKSVMRAIRSISRSDSPTFSYSTTLSLVLGDLSIRAVSKMTGRTSAEVRRFKELISDKLRVDDNLKSIYDFNGDSTQTKAMKELKSDVDNIILDLHLPAESIDTMMDDINASFLLPGETLLED